MKMIRFWLILAIALLGTAAYSIAESGCPEGQYRDPVSGKCTIPGEDPSGVTDLEYIRELIEDGQALCKKGWCCQGGQAIHERCLKSGDKEGQGACKSCIKY